MRITSSGIGRRERSEGEPDAKREESCMVLLLTKMAFKNATGFQDLEPAVRVVRWSRRRELGCPVASVFPEFIARDGQERASRGRQGKTRPGWSGPQRSEDTAGCALTAPARALQSRER